VFNDGWSLWSLDDPAQPAELCRFDLAVRVPNSFPDGQFVPFLTPDGRFLVEPVVEPPVGPEPVGPEVVPSVARGFRVRETSNGRVRYTLRLPAGEYAVARPTLAAGGTRFVVLAMRPAAGNRGGRPEAVVRGLDTATGDPAWAWDMPAPPAGNTTRTAAQTGVAALGSGVGWMTWDISPDGARLVLAPRNLRSDLPVWVLDTAGGTLDRELRVPDTSMAKYSWVTAGPAGQVVVQSQTQSFVWDAAGAEPRARLTNFTWQYFRPAFSADGRRLFTIDNYDNSYTGRVVRVWCLETGRELMWFPVPTPPDVHWNGTTQSHLDRPLSVEGDRLCVQMADGVRVFDGSPRPAGGER